VVEIDGQREKRLPAPIVSGGRPKEVFNAPKEPGCTEGFLKVFLDGHAAIGFLSSSPSQIACSSIFDIDSRFILCYSFFQKENNSSVLDFHSLLYSSIAHLHEYHRRRHIPA
jgi:hypothetical protein